MNGGRRRGSANGTRGAPPVRYGEACGAACPRRGVPQCEYGGTHAHAPESASAAGGTETRTGPRPAPPARPDATHKPKDAPAATVPGDLVQLDTMQVRPLPGVRRSQFTAVDGVSRTAVVGGRGSATAGTAAAFLADLLARLPFPVRTLQVDGGSEWMADFGAACREQGIALWVLPPRKPKGNGYVERLNRTGREAFWECYGDDRDLPRVTQALAVWEDEYNTMRPHQSLAMRTPAQFLAPTCPPRPEPIHAIDRPRRIRYTASIRGVAQPGSAPALGAGGRRFKSSRPDHHLDHWDAEKAEG